MKIVQLHSECGFITRPEPPPCIQRLCRAPIDYLCATIVQLCLCLLPLLIKISRRFTTFQR